MSSDRAVEPFRLEVEVQRKLVGKLAAVLASGGKFLFHVSKSSLFLFRCHNRANLISLGHEAYRKTLEAEGVSPGWDTT